MLENLQVKGGACISVKQLQWEATSQVKQLQGKPAEATAIYSDEGK